ALAIEIAEACLSRHGRAEPAAELADRLLAGELPATWRPHVVELGARAHAAAGRWTRVVEIRRAALTDSSPPDEVAATAALALDRGNDAAGALALCLAAIERLGTASPATNLGWLRVIDVAIDAASPAADENRLELLDRRAQLAAALPG